MSRLLLLMTIGATGLGMTLVLGCTKDKARKPTSETGFHDARVFEKTFSLDIDTCVNNPLNIRTETMMECLVGQHRFDDATRIYHEGGANDNFFFLHPTPVTVKEGTYDLSYVVTKTEQVITVGVRASVTRPRTAFPSTHPKLFKRIIQAALNEPGAPFSSQVVVRVLTFQ